MDHNLRYYYLLNKQFLPTIPFSRLVLNFYVAWVCAHAVEMRSTKQLIDSHPSWFAVFRIFATCIAMSQ